MLHQALLIALALGAAEPVPQAAGPLTIVPVDDKNYVTKVLQARKGKPVLVSFWASYCTPCLAELPELVALQKKGKQVVIVNVDPPDDPARLQKVAVSHKLPKFETLQVQNDDPQPFIDAVDKKWMGEVPFAALYGKDGTLSRTFSGEQKVADLARALEEAGKP